MSTYIHLHRSLFSGCLQQVVAEHSRRFGGPFRFLSASPSFIPCAHSGIHFRGVLLASRESKNLGLVLRVPGEPERATELFLRASKSGIYDGHLKCPAEENPLGRASRRRIRDSFTSPAKFLHALRRRCVSTCGVNLHWHAWNHRAIVRLTVRFPVSSRRVYQASSHPKWKNIPGVTTLPRDFLLKITRVESPMSLNVPARVINTPTRSCRSMQERSLATENFSKKKLL